MAADHSRVVIWDSVSGKYDHEPKKAGGEIIYNLQIPKYSDPAGALHF